MDNATFTALMKRDPIFVEYRKLIASLHLAGISIIPPSGLKNIHTLITFQDGSTVEFQAFPSKSVRHLLEEDEKNEHCN